MPAAGRLAAQLACRQCGLWVVIGWKLAC